MSWSAMRAGAPNAGWRRQPAPAAALSKATRRGHLAPVDRGDMLRKSANGLGVWLREQNARGVALHTGVFTPQSAPVADTGAFNGAIKEMVACG